jgi:hypothetical protein
MSFLHTLRTNAYSKLDVDSHIVDMQGWMDPPFSEVVKKSLSSKDRNAPLTVIEVGSWKGLSASTLASTIKSMGFTCASIICIDTWLGAPEFWTWGLTDSNRGGSLQLDQGWPHVFSTFTKNIKKLGHDDIVAPLPLSSIQAADVLKYYKITADLIYIDAAHEYEPVKHDICAYWKLLKVGGMMFGDDYTDGWPGVKRGVNELIGTPTVQGVLWSAYKISESI